MSKIHVNARTIAPPGNYSHLVVVNSGKLVFLSGQVPKAPDGSIVGIGDLETQARQCLQNVERALAEIGAMPEDIVKLTVFVVGYEPSHRSLLAAARADILPSKSLPASTLIGVESLAHEDFLIEIEAIALLP